MHIFSLVLCSNRLNNNSKIELNFHNTEKKMFRWQLKNPIITIDRIPCVSCELVKFILYFSCCIKIEIQFKNCFQSADKFPDNMTVWCMNKFFFIRNGFGCQFIAENAFNVIQSIQLSTRLQNNRREREKTKINNRNCMTKNTNMSKNEGKCSKFERDNKKNCDSNSKS